MSLFLPLLFLVTLSAWAEGPVLTQAVQVLNLSIEAAKSNLPVLLRGVVISGRDLPDGQAVVHDGSGSVYLFGEASLAPALMRTNLVEIEGVTDPGEFARRVIPLKVRVLGQGQIPPARHVAYDEMMMGQMDSQWVEVEGCLRSCVYLPETMPSQRGGMDMKLATGGRPLPIQVFDHGADPAWVDGTLRVRGICFHKFNKNRQFYQMYLCVPEGEPVLLETRPPDLSGLPPKRIASFLQFPTGGEVGHRVRVNGVVTYSRPGSFFYLQDGERGLLVVTGDPSPLAVGDEVSVAGFPAPGDYSPILEDPTFVVLAHRTPLPTAIPVRTPNDAFQHDGELICGRAKLLGALLQDNNWTYSLQMGNAVFTASLLRRGDFPVEPQLATGSELGFTGISTAVMGPVLPQSLVAKPQSLRLLLRTPEDLLLIKPPPWWTPQHILVAAAVVVGLLSACILAIVLVDRARLRRQRAGQRAAEIEFAAVFNERNRIARELHDTLAQGLGAISLHLDLVKEQRECAPEKAAKHLDIAYQTAQQSLTEVRNSISNMRSHILETATLAEALQRILRQFTDDTGTEGRFVIAGDARRLAPVIENNLLCLGQESISNAIKHARARVISVALEYQPNQVSLAVRDDGGGFDPAHPPAGNHFGLAGQRERAQQMGGTLEVKSAPGCGTEVKVCIPI